MYTCIQETIIKSFEHFREREAISAGRQRLTYGGLEARISSFAGYFEQAGIREGAHVGIVMEKGVDMVALVLASLCSRVVFVPVDISQPPERIAALLGSCDVHHVFLDSKGGELEQRLSAAGMQAHEAAAVPQPAENAAARIGQRAYHPADPVYIYFTSGTEGMSKGVVGKNEGLAHFIDWEISTLGLEAGTRVSFLSSPGFDASLRDMLVPLCAGGLICIPGSREHLLSSSLLVEWLTEEQVNVVHCVPGIFRNINAGLSPGSLPHLRYVLMAGERIIPRELEKWFACFGSRIQLVNLYGATEVTMAKTCYFIKPEDAGRAVIPIGKPMSGAEILILDEKMQPCDVLEEGEIYISTPYRTLGYYKSPELNAARFVPAASGNLLYKTGDTGRRKPNGDFEFTGRKGAFIKIRGNRVDPAEVENYAVKHEKVIKCVAVPQEEEGQAELALYLVAEEALSVRLFREYMASGLPAYMVPKYITFIDTIPLTVNGKVNIAALPPPLIVVEDVVLPVNRVEKKIQAIWADMLKLDPAQISTKARFFELGGNSLLLMNMISRICKALEVRIPLSAVLRNATIHHIAALLKDTVPEPLAPIMPAEKKCCYELSAPQKRLFVTALLDKESRAYNMFMEFVIGETPGPEQVQRIFGLLIDRHESLRTSFDIVNGEPVQIVHEQVAFSVEVLEEQPGSSAAARFVRPFDLRRAPLIRVGYMPLPGAKGVQLLVDMHHIISDGASLEILKTAFFEALKGVEPSRPRLQYRDYALWSNRHLSDQAIQKQKEYWTKAFQTLPPVLHIDEVIQDRALLSRKTGSRLKFFLLGNTLTEKLGSYAKAGNTTLSILLLAAYKILLHRYTGLRDIVVGMSVNGRIHPDSQGMVGFFVNLLPVRTRPEQQLSFSQYAGQVHEACMHAYEHQEFDYSHILNRINAGRKSTPVQLIATVFTMQDTMQVDYDPAEWQDGRIYASDIDPKYDLFLDAFTNGHTIALRFTFSPRALLDDTVNRMAADYQQIIAQCLDAGQTRLGEIALSPGASKHAGQQEAYINSFDFSS